MTENMEEQFFNYLANGYDIHLNTLRTTSGLHHPDSKDRFEIILSRRLPGFKRKGGAAYAKGQMGWKLLKDPKAWELVLKDLQKKVDRIALETAKR